MLIIEKICNRRFELFFDIGIAGYKAYIGKLTQEKMNTLLMA